MLSCHARYLWVCVLLSTLFLCSGFLSAEELTITKDEVWDTDRQVSSVIKIQQATVRVAPGVTINFTGRGRLLLAHGSSFEAIGEPERRITLRGQALGSISGYGANLVLEHCLLSGLGIPGADKGRSIDLSTAKGKSILIRFTDIINCGGLYLKPSGGSLEVINSQFKKGETGRPSIYTYGSSDILIENNIFEKSGVGIGDQGRAVIRNNIVISGSIGGWRTESMLIQGNYVHQPKPNGSYCVPGATGVIKDNVFRGGSWTLAKITGEVTGNVIISLPHEGFDRPDVYDDNCTHEHICGMGADSVVRRNIFIGASYGGVMGLGRNVCTGLDFSNNTLDMKNRGRCVMTNHLPEAKAENIKIANNIFMRCDGCQDESRVKNAMSFIDYNLWSQAPASGKRYDRIVMDGLSVGDQGFGAHDIPKTGSLSPALVVQDPEAVFPVSDKDLCERAASVAQVLKHYRDAYTLVPGSAAINAGDARVIDESILDSKPDIGAIEFVPKK